MSTSTNSATWSPVTRVTSGSGDNTLPGAAERQATACLPADLPEGTLNPGERAGEVGSLESQFRNRLTAFPEGSPSLVLGTRPGQPQGVSMAWPEKS
jgi:hypothetical protein